MIEKIWTAMGELTLAIDLKTGAGRVAFSQFWMTDDYSPD
jgi:hypothetical protein